MTITVKAAEGLRVPMEGAPRKQIGAEPVPVRSTAYYLRRLADGDLVRVDADGEAENKPAKGGKK